MIYTEVLAAEICERLMGGESLRRICEDDTMPGRTTVLRWLATDQGDFGPRYVRARVVQIMGEADDLLDIANTPHPGQRVVEKADGKVEVVTADMVERSRLKIDTRKWLLAKLLPKVYGDRLQQVVEVAAKPEKEMPLPELARRIAFLLRVGDEATKNKAGTGSAGQGTATAPRLISP